MTVRHDYDVVIVGAGVAGGALAARLARDGLTVLVLERTRVHVDRIRGEWLAPGASARPGNWACWTRFWTPADTSFP